MPRSLSPSPYGLPRIDTSREPADAQQEASGTPHGQSETDDPEVAEGDRSRARNERGRFEHQQESLPSPLSPMKVAGGKVGAFIERTTGHAVGKTRDGQYAARTKKDGAVVQVSVGNKGLRLQGDGSKRSGEFRLGRQSGFNADYDSHDRTDSGVSHSTMVRAGASQDNVPTVKLGRTKHHVNHRSNSLTVEASRDPNAKQTRLSVQRTQTWDANEPLLHRTVTDGASLTHSPQGLDISASHSKTTNDTQRRYTLTARPRRETLAIDARVETAGMLGLDSANAGIDTVISRRPQGFEVNTIASADLGRRDGLLYEQAMATGTARLRQGAERLEAGNASGVFTVRATSDLRPFNLPVSGYVQAHTSGRMQYTPPPGQGWTATTEPFEFSQGFVPAPAGLENAADSSEEEDA